jgi:hypothetical protein
MCGITQLVDTAGLANTEPSFNLTAGNLSPLLPEWVGATLSDDPHWWESAGCDSVCLGRGGGGGRGRNHFMQVDADQGYLV